MLSQIQKQQSQILGDLALLFKNTNKLVWKTGFGNVHLCNDKTVKQITKAKTFKAMKKQVKKLSLTTDKVVSLSSSAMQNLQGGITFTTIRPSKSESYNCILAPSNGGRTYNC